MLFLWTRQTQSTIIRITSLFYDIAVRFIIESFILPAASCLAKLPSAVLPLIRANSPSTFASSPLPPSESSRLLKPSFLFALLTRRLSSSDTHLHFVRFQHSCHGQHLPYRYRLLTGTAWPSRVLLNPQRSLRRKCILLTVSVYGTLQLEIFQKFAISFLANISTRELILRAVCFVSVTWFCGRIVLLEWSVLLWLPSVRGQK